MEGHTKYARRVMAAAACVASLLASAPAYALSVYAELAGAVSQFRGNNSAFFGPGTDNPSGYGYGANFGGFVSFTGGAAPLEFQLGIQERMSAGSAGSNNYSILTLYPAARIQFSRIYLSGGVSPFVYRGTGITDFKPVASPLAYAAEFGFLFPVTPRFSFGLGASAEFVSVNGTSGPAPVLQGFGLMRVYWGIGSTGGGGSASAPTSNEFRGWRYPFGNIR